MNERDFHEKYHQSLDGIGIPPRIARLPIDPDRRLPVPWFVHWAGGKPDFRVVAAGKREEAVRHKRCWICGDPLGKFLAFTIGPMCAVNRVTSEPAAHRDCAEFAVRACPFLAHPEAHRREKDLGELSPDNCPGVPIARNPGVTAIWITHAFRIFDSGNGALFQIGDPIEVTWWCRGRAATREEALHSITSGEVALLESGMTRGALDRKLSEVIKLLPAAPEQDTVATAPFRLRCKVIEQNGRRYMIAAGLLRADGKIECSAMSDVETIQVKMSIDEYNALPYHWFEEQGPAPKGEAVRPHVITRNVLVHVEPAVAGAKPETETKH